MAAGALLSLLDVDEPTPDKYAGALLLAEGLHALRLLTESLIAQSNDRSRGGRR